MQSQRRATWYWLWGIGCAALLAVVTWSMFAARKQTLEEMATPRSLQAWEAWRDDVRHQKEMSAPVERRVPKSVEPPMLVLLRDHFAVMLAGAILFSAVLYAVLAWFITGVLTGEARGRESRPPFQNQ